MSGLKLLHYRTVRKEHVEKRQMKLLHMNNHPHAYRFSTLISLFLCADEVVTLF